LQTSKNHKRQNKFKSPNEASVAQRKLSASISFKCTLSEIFTQTFFLIFQSSIHSLKMFVNFPRLFENILYILSKILLLGDSEKRILRSLDEEFIYINRGNIKQLLIVISENRCDCLHISV